MTPPPPADRIWVSAGTTPYDLRACGNSENNGRLGARLADGTSHYCSPRNGPLDPQCRSSVDGEERPERNFCRSERGSFRGVCAEGKPSEGLRPKAREGRSHRTRPTPEAEPHAATPLGSGNNMEVRGTPYLLILQLFIAHATPRCQRGRGCINQRFQNRECVSG